MASEKAREIFESIMKEKPLKVREHFQEAMAEPVLTVLEEEKRVVAEALFLDDDGGDEELDDGPKSNGEQWGSGHWDDDSEKSDSPSKIQTEAHDADDKDEEDDRPFSRDRLKRAKRDKDRFNKNFSSQGYDEKKSSDNIEA